MRPWDEGWSQVSQVNLTSQKGDKAGKARGLLNREYMGQDSLLLLDTAALNTVCDKGGTGRNPQVGLVRKLHYNLLCASSLLADAV